MMSAETTTKALLIALVGEPSACVATINRLNPEHLCFFIPETVRSKIETQVQPHLLKLPKKWDSLFTPDPHAFGACYKAINQPLADLLKTWDINPGELVVDLSGASAAMAAATGLATLPYSSQLLSLKPALVAGDGPVGELIIINGTAHTWQQDNPWTEAAVGTRRHAADFFNQGVFRAAMGLFRHIELRVSGGQKPLYHALADLARAYDCWDHFQYKSAWDSLKTATKALDMASVFGGPSSMKTLVPYLKSNAGFLEKIVLDPAEIRANIGPDLLANARRRAEHDHAFDTAVATTVRALEAFAQVQLFKQHQIRSNDAHIEKLPGDLQETCRTCCLDDVDGKFKLPMRLQFRVLAAFGDPLGQAYLAHWPQLKPLLDAWTRSPLGHGFESISSERYHQLLTLVLKITGVPETALPKFPTLQF